jgi:hypothetical protein
LVAATRECNRKLGTGDEARELIRSLACREFASSFHPITLRPVSRMNLAEFELMGSNRFSLAQIGDRIATVPTA